MKNKQNTIFWILVALVVILGLLVLYAFVIQPNINGYAVKNYKIGVNEAVLQIMQIAATCQPVPLTQENLTLNLVALECYSDSQQENSDLVTFGEDFQGF